MTGTVRWIPSPSHDEVLCVRGDGALLGKVQGCGQRMMFVYNPKTGVFTLIPGGAPSLEEAKSKLLDEVSKSYPPIHLSRPLKWLLVGKDSEGYLTWQWCQTKQEILEFVGDRGIKIVATCEGVPVNAVITVDISPVDGTN